VRELFYANGAPQVSEPTPPGWPSLHQAVQYAEHGPIGLPSGTGKLVEQWRACGGRQLGRLTPTQRLADVLGDDFVASRSR
jgi:hypothetical protein